MGGTPAAARPLSLVLAVLLQRADDGAHRQRLDPLAETRPCQSQSAEDTAVLFWWCFCSESMMGYTLAAAGCLGLDPALLVVACERRRTLVLVVVLRRVDDGGTPAAAGRLGSDQRCQLQPARERYQILIPAVPPPQRVNAPSDLVYFVPGVGSRKKKSTGKPGRPW